MVSLRTRGSHKDADKIFKSQLLVYTSIHIVITDLYLEYSFNYQTNSQNLLLADYRLTRFSRPHGEVHLPTPKSRGKGR